MKNTFTFSLKVYFFRTVLSFRNVTIDPELESTKMLGNPNLLEYKGYSFSIYEAHYTPQIIVM